MLRLNKWKITNGIVLAFIILVLYTVGMYWIFSICQENDRNFVARQIKSCEASGYSSYIVKGNEVTCLD